jgi:transposase
MIRYIGLDVHRLLIRACAMDPQGAVVGEWTFDATRDAIQDFATENLTPEDRVVLEVTFNTWAIADIIAAHVGSVVVSNPRQTKAIAQAKIKTDKVDARVLAHLLRCDYLPLVWPPDPQTRLLRTLVSRRCGLVSERTRIKNRIHGILARALIPRPSFDLFGTKGRAWLGEQPLDPVARDQMESDLRLLDFTESELARVDDAVAALAQKEQRARNLMTLPGVDYATAMTVLAALGDITRFRDGNHAASFLGLVPATYQSGEHCYHGRITKQGNAKARWMLIQGAQRMGSNHGPLGVFFRRLKKRKNHNVAVVAVARKMVTIAWHMLTNNEPYRYALPKATQAKLAELRVKATGVRKRGGTPKGQARPANYGTGTSYRRVPSLAEVLTGENMPAATAFPFLKPGEKKALKRMSLERFAVELHAPTFKLRKTTTANQNDGA